MDEKIDIIDIKIFPSRILKPETTEKILNLLYDMDNLFRVIVHGPSLPAVVNYGPAKGLPVNHEDRKKISIKDDVVELKLKVGEIIATVPVSELNEFLEVLDESLPEIIKFSYEVHVGVFTRIETSISDYLKYGLKFEDHIDDRFIGMSDPSSRASDTIKLIKTSG